MSLPDTVCAAFQKTAAIDPDAVALRTPGDAVTVTWREYADNVRRTAAGYAAIGVKRGDTVAIMLTNRPEFAWVDSGAMHLGAVAFSIYNTSSPEQIEYLFGNAENRIVVTETALLPAILASGASLEHIICIDGKPDGATMSLEEMVAGGDPDFDFDAAWQAVQPDDLLTLIYTSGTTGPPKGVQLAHSNQLFCARAAKKVVDVGFGDRITSYLPAAHVADRATSQYFNAIEGVQVTYIADPRTIAAALPDCRPTVWFAVPRIWEKIKVGIEAKVAAEESPVKKRLAGWAFATAAKHAEAKLAGRTPNRLDEAQYALADKLVLSKIRAALGLDQLKWCWSGAASIAPETLTFFLGLGINICEIWGMSESTGAGTLNPPGKVKIGTVGPPLPGMQVRLAEDNELLIKGPGVMVGYRKDPEKTAEAIDADGWLHTGDIGTVDEDGYVSIVDRKKEIIITSAGKNMSPANIESTVRGESSLIGQVVAIGDGRKYVTALITLDPEAAPVHAKNLGLGELPLEELVTSPVLLAEIGAVVDRANKRLHGSEQIKRFTVLGEAWLPDSDELTPTAKLKRRIIHGKYAPQIEELYAE
jgi:long-chain acyl-CoA synthetase